MRKILLPAALAMASSMALFSTPAAACNIEPYPGSICTFAFDWCPRGFIPADGRTLKVREYQVLFSLIGYRYGSNNSDSFAIPDLRGRSVIGAGTGPGLKSVALGAKVGQQELALSAVQVPLQPHTATFTGTGVDSGGSTVSPDTGTVGGTVGGTVTVTTMSGEAAQTVSTQSPAIGQTVCIAIEGIYPLRP